MASTQSTRAVFSCTAEVAASCRGLRAHLERTKRASPEEIARFWPAEDQDEGEPWPWVYAYGQLQRLIGRGAAGPEGEEGADRLALAALREDPQDVGLSDGSQVRVYPKGLEALILLDELDWELSWLTGRADAVRAAIEQGSIPESVPSGPSSALAQLAELRAEHLGRILCQACSPGPAIDVAALESPPARYRSLSPGDALRIHQAFLTVNLAPLVAARALAAERSPGEDRGAERPSWSVFVAQLADRLRRSPRYVTRHRSLVSWLAQVQLAAPAVESELDS